MFRFLEHQVCAFLLYDATASYPRLFQDVVSTIYPPLAFEITFILAIMYGRLRERKCCKRCPLFRVRLQSA